LPRSANADVSGIAVVFFRLYSLRYVVLILGRDGKPSEQSQCAGERLR
jgi:hypothetical protein